MHFKQTQQEAQGLQAFSFLLKPLMMNIGNLSSMQSVVVKVKEGSGLKANCVFVILLLSLDVFESDSPEKKS